MPQPIEIRIKRGTASYLAELNPVLDAGEPCLEIDTNKIKYGDGTTPWNLLAYAGGSDVQAVGENNTVTGTNAVVAGGATNTAAGANSIVGSGTANTASGQNAAVLAGTANTASGLNSSVISGNTTTASAAYSVGVGEKAVANSYGQVAFSSGNFNVPGDAQVSLYNLRGRTISDVSTVLAFDGVDSSNAGISTAKRLELPIGVAWNFDIKVTAYDTTADLAAFWTVRGGVRRNLTGVVSFIGTPTIETAADSGWSSEATIDVRATDANDPEPHTLAIDASGGAGKTIYWHAAVLVSQLKPKPPLTSDMFVNVQANAAIQSLAVSIDGGGSDITPAFNPAIQDYYIYSATNGVNAYNLSINGVAFSTGQIETDKALHVIYGGQEYFIRVLPTDFPTSSVVQKNAGYRPGYYLCNPSQGGSGYWFIVYNENLVPVWYVRDDRYNGFCLHYGGEPNKLVFHRWSTPSVPRHAVTLGLNTMSVVGYTMKNDSTNSNPFWECHESHVIAGPPNRKGNFISMTYAYGCGGSYMPGNGLYIQELTPDGQTVVWDWYSHDYFDISQYGDYFHANSIDVNPVTGDVLLSCRHPGGAFCIDYATKQVKWALQGRPCCTSTGTFQAVARSNMTQNTKWLSVYNDPYTGPAGNHDARWHVDVPPLTPGNDIISLFDDQTGYGPHARGVIYEIDLVNNRGIFRAHSTSSNGTSGAQGGFTLLKENDGSYSHVPNFHGQTPSVVEFNNGTNLNPDQNVVFIAAFPTSVHYRVPKVRLDQLDINYMRTTAGRTLTTP